MVDLASRTQAAVMLADFQWQVVHFETQWCSHLVLIPMLGMRKNAGEENGGCHVTTCAKCSEKEYRSWIKILIVAHIFQDSAEKKRKQR